MAYKQPSYKEYQKHKNDKAWLDKQKKDYQKYIQKERTKKRIIEHKQHGKEKRYISRVQKGKITPRDPHPASLFKEKAPVVPERYAGKSLYEISMKEKGGKQWLAGLKVSERRYLAREYMSSKGYDVYNLEKRGDELYDVDPERAPMVYVPDYGRMQEIRTENYKSRPAHEKLLIIVGEGLAKGGAMIAYGPEFIGEEVIGRFQSGIESGTLFSKHFLEQKPKDYVPKESILSREFAYGNIFKYSNYQKDTSAW